MAELNAYKRKRQMKRLSAVLVVLVMLGICTSSYGYFLIYTLSGQIKGTNGTVDVKKKTISFRGYLVMNFDDDTNSIVDANMFISGKDHDRRVYVQLNMHDSNGFLDANILPQDERNFYTLHGNSPFGFSALIMGDVHHGRIIGRDAEGLLIKKDIATSPSGAITQEEGIFLALDQNIAAVGNMSASFYSVATKGVNNPNNHISPHTQEGTVDTLKEILASHHYKQVNIPPP
jgi:hypothetical protein